MISQVASKLKSGYKKFRYRCLFNQEKSLERPVYTFFQMMLFSPYQDIFSFNIRFPSIFFSEIMFWVAHAILYSRQYCVDSKKEKKKKYWWNIERNANTGAKMVDNNAMMIIINLLCIVQFGYMIEMEDHP